MPKSERELKIELVDLRAENVRLRKLRAEDKQFAEDRLELAVAMAKDIDVEDLETRIMDLQKTVEEEGAVIDRICVYLRKRNDPDLRKKNS